MPGVFAHPFLHWVGMDTDPRTTPEALAEFNRFYSTTHVHEVLAAHPGFVSVSRYELAEAEAGSGPRWLAVYAMQDATAAEQYVKDNERPWLHRRKYSPWPAARRRAKTVWRMIWRQVAAAESADQALESVVLVGTHTAVDSGTCFELYREFAHPAPGSPRFCAIYAADAPPAANGPETLWRLVYRRLPPPE